MKKAACCTRFHHVLPLQTPTTTPSSRWGSCGTEREQNSAARHQCSCSKPKSLAQVQSLHHYAMLPIPKMKGTVSGSVTKTHSGLTPRQDGKQIRFHLGLCQFSLCEGLPSVMWHVGVLTTQAVRPTQQAPVQQAGRAPKPSNRKCLVQNKQSRPACLAKGSVPEWSQGNRGYPHRPAEVLTAETTEHVAWQRCHRGVGGDVGGGLSENLYRMGLKGVV